MRRLLHTAAGVAAIMVAASAAGLVLARAASEPRIERLTFTCDTDAECAALPPCALKPGCDGTPWTEPYRLVGYGCAGASGPLYRDEEDEFPAGGCKIIEGIF